MRISMRSALTTGLFVFFGMFLVPHLSYATTYALSDNAFTSSVTEDVSNFSWTTMNTGVTCYADMMGMGGYAGVGIYDVSNNWATVAQIPLAIYNQDMALNGSAYSGTVSSLWGHWIGATVPTHLIAGHSYSVTSFCDGGMDGNDWGGFAVLSTNSFSTNPRRAVVLVAFYALRQSHDGGCDQTIPSTNGNCVSNWNFLNDQNYPGPQAISQLVPSFGINASDWAIPSDTYYDANSDTGISPSFYSDLADYGYGTSGGNYGSVGRGGQCVFFANNILYRSQSDTSARLNFLDMSNNADANLQNTVEGDVLFLYGDENSGFTTNHVAIVVELYPGPDGIEALDVIDSNYIPDISGVSNREVIARHSFCLVNNSNCPFYPNAQMIQNHYKIWTGTSYYATAYDPNQ
jgi:hypothetical protein